MKGIKLIYESSHSLIYLKSDEGVEQRVVKVARNTLPADKQLFYLQREYVFTQQLNHIDGVRKVIEETTLQDQYAIVLEFIPGQSLKDTFIQKRKPFREIIDILIHITAILRAVHNCNIIHKDLTSRNILVSESAKGTYSVHLIDFALAANLEENRLFEHNPRLWATEVELAGTWAYMAPEQTGRVNRKLDARTDLYALGINLYEMLTGRHPFVANDPVEWFHAHLAQAPVYPKSQNGLIPEALAEICMKLLEKNPANRYSSANALYNDLEYIRESLSDHTSTVSFTPRKHSHPQQMTLSEQYYNRETELQSLLGIWNRVCQGESHLLLLSGYAGTGKTRFAHQIKGNVRERGGYFIEGKFDPLTQNRPYAAWLQAFESFINQILVEKSSQLEMWKAMIQQALGHNAKLLSDLIPKLQLIIGKPPEITDIGIQDAQNRINYVFQSFIDAISIEQHPLVILIDDWQWADAASVELLKLLTQQVENDYVLIICAFREQEMEDNLLAGESIGILKKVANMVHHIHLDNWNRDTLNDFIRDSINCEADHCAPLSNVIFQKTRGNPFFVIQMLNTLYDKGMLTQTGHDQWEYDLQGIGQLTISDNVASLLSGNVLQLDEAHREVLYTAACIGESFSSGILRHLVNLSQEKLEAYLGDLAEENLLIQSETEYRFAHQRLRTICYEYIPSSERDILHVRIGLWMVSNLPTAEQEEYIFEIVNHLNKGRHLLRDESWLKRYNFDRLRLTVLNLKAARKSRASIAWENALSYLETGAQLLPSDSWQTAYDITYQLYREWAEIAFMSGNGEKAMELAQFTLKYTQDPIDQIHLYNIQIIYHNTHESYQKAYYIGKEALRKLGFAIRDEWSKPMLFAKQRTVRELIERFPPETLQQREKVPNPYIEFAIKILTNLEYSAFQGFPRMVWSIIVHKAIFLSLKYGNIPESAYIYATYGHLLIEQDADYKNAYRFGYLGLQLSYQSQHPALHARVCARYGGYILPWSKPLHHIQPILEEGFHKGREGGELKIATENLTHNITQQFAQGISLLLIEKKMQEQNRFIQSINILPSTNILNKILQLSQNLTISAKVEPEKKEFTPQQQDELPKPESICCEVIEMIDAFFLDDIEYAQTLGKHISYLADLIKGRIESALFRFYYALILSKSYQNIKPAERNSLIQSIIEQESYLKKWSQHIPETFQQLYTLVYAELNKLRGNKWEAGELYDQAIVQARQHGFIHVEALSNELAGKFWLGMGKQEFARSYFQKALFLYDKWGAKRICNRLQENFPQFFHIQSINRDTTSSTTDIDQFTLLQASQTLSGEIVLSNLLEKLMRIVIANAGAVHGAFVSLNGQSLILRAEGNLRNGIDVSHTIPLSHSDSVPQSVILYVARTQQELVMIDACREEPYNNDPYIQQQDLLSVACIPIIYKEKLSAIIYLENNLIAGAFTNERLEILRILSSQIAISLENASLYEHLEEKVAERTRALNEKNLALGETLDKLKQTQAKLVDAAKMASLGQLTAGIAHEINNPLNFISANIKPLRLDFEDLKSLFAGFNALKYAADKSASLEAVFSHAEEIDADFLFQEMENLLYGIEEGAHRTQKIVEGLRTFSFGGKETLQSVNIHDGIDATLTLLTNKWKKHIIIEKYYDEHLPYIPCMPGKLNQVFMNILQNAIQAIDERISLQPEHQGVIQISTHQHEDHVLISIQDNGIGMKKDVITRIFEPFFTTRDVGEGTGLGLSITFGIIEQHRGKIEVKSKWMEGSEFVIKLPMKDDHAES